MSPFSSDDEEYITDTESEEELSQDTPVQAPGTLLGFSPGPVVAAAPPTPNTNSSGSSAATTTPESR